MRGFRRLLLVSVSALSLACTGQTALAQDGGKLIIGGTVGLLAAPNDLARGTVTANAYDIEEINYDDPYASYVSGVLGYRLGNGWDILARLSSTQTEDTLSEFTYYDDEDLYGGEIETGFDYQTLDLEVGFTPMLDDNLDIRFAVGLRALSYSDRLVVRDKIGGGLPGSDSYENSFSGVGPRVAIDFSTRLPDSPFGLSASAAASVVFGELEQTYDSEVEETFDKTVGTLEAKVTGDYHIENIGKLSLGYRVEQIADMHEFDHASGILENQVTHGPVLEFLGSF